MPDANGYHAQIAAELNRMNRNGYSNERDDELGLDQMLLEALNLLVAGYTVKAGVKIVQCRAYLQRNSKNPMQIAVEKFMAACDQEVKKYPELPSEDIMKLRIRLMREELLGAKEVQESDNPYGLLLDKSDELVKSMLNGDLVGISDGLADVLYVVFGTAAAYGIDIQSVFDEVQRSNMTKAVWDVDNQRFTVIKDAGGKIIKPESFSEADLRPIVKRQIEEGLKLEYELSENEEVVLGVL